jgi:cation:H+ antiporter
LTLVAVGTSLPELATTVVAALRNEDDLALGNIVGSNLFNILGVAGPVGLVRNLDAEEGLPVKAGSLFQLSQLQVQMVGMLLVTILVFAMIVRGGGRIERGKGVLLLLVYVLIMFNWATLK